MTVASKLALARLLGHLIRIAENSRALSRSARHAER